MPALLPAHHFRAPPAVALALRHIARRQGIGHCTLIRNIVSDYVAANRDLHVPEQVQSLPNGLNTKFNSGLDRRDEKRKTLRDERPSRTGLLRDRPPG